MGRVSRRLVIDVELVEEERWSREGRRGAELARKQTGVEG
jgi:hypothetical protein